MAHALQGFSIRKKGTPRKHRMYQVSRKHRMYHVSRKHRMYHVSRNHRMYHVSRKHRMYQHVSLIACISSSVAAV